MQLLRRSGPRSVSIERPKVVPRRPATSPMAWVTAGRPERSNAPKDKSAKSENVVEQEVPHLWSEVVTDSSSPFLSSEGSRREVRAQPQTPANGELTQNLGHSIMKKYSSESGARRAASGRFCEFSCEPAPRSFSILALSTIFNNSLSTRCASW